MRLMDTGMLPRRAEGLSSLREVALSAGEDFAGAELLLASIDAADDFAAIGLNDCTALKGFLAPFKLGPCRAATDQLAVSGAGLEDPPKPAAETYLPRAGRARGHPLH